MNPEGEICKEVAAVVFQTHVKHTEHEAVKLTHSCSCYCWEYSCGEMIKNCFASAEITQRLDILIVLFINKS